MSWARTLLSMEVRKSMSYRVDFWVTFIGSLLAEVGVAYVLWQAIYERSGTDKIGGYSFPAMILYYVLSSLVKRAVQGSERGGISFEIYDGSLTRYLVYPVSFIGYKWVQRCADAAISLLQLAIAWGLMVLWIGMPADRPFSIEGIFLGLGAIAVSSFLCFLMMASIEMVAFWADSVWSLLVMFRFTTWLLGGALLPLSLFPAGLQRVLHLLPFEYLISFPTRALMGEVSIVEWLEGVAISLIWCGVFWAMNQWIWRRGTLQYTGVGV